MELGPRDRLSQAFMGEVDKGRAIDTEHGPMVHLDLRHLGQRVIDERLPFVRELCRKYQNIDPVHEMIPVRPVVHYVMGGVHTDLDGATPVAGLYAAGEVACVSINGANRLGSNSLPECLVFGARAGQAAVEYVSTARHPAPAAMAQASDEVLRVEALLHKSDGRESIAGLRDEMQETMEASAGIYRTGDSLARGAAKLKELQDRFKDVAIHDESSTFNTERVAALELGCMLDVAETMVASALAREESRGAHQRTDFPDRDDERYLVHKLAYREPDGSCRLEESPVTITRWPPGERVYGR